MATANDWNNMETVHYLNLLCGICESEGKSEGIRKYPDYHTCFITTKKGNRYVCTVFDFHYDCLEKVHVALLSGQYKQNGKLPRRCIQQ